MRWLRSMLFLLLVPGVAGAQRGRLDDPADVPPAIAIGVLRESYQWRPVVERVVLTLKTRAGEATAGERGRYEVRWNPGIRGDLEDATLRLDLGDLAVWAGNGRIIATHRGAPDVFFEGGYEGPLERTSLAGVLPPLIIPQLVLARGSPNPTMWDPIPLVQGVIWTGVKGARVGRGRTLDGTFEGGSITASVSADLNVLRRIEMDWDDGSRLRLDITRLADESPADWQLDPSGRTRVPHLHELAPKPRVIRVGEPVSRLLPLTLGNEPWDARGANGAEPMVIVVLRPAGGEEGLGLEDAGAFLAALDGASADALGRAAIIVVTDGDMAPVDVVPERDHRDGDVLALWARSSTVGEIPTGTGVVVIIDQAGVARWVGEPVRLGSDTPVDPVLVALEGVRGAGAPPE